MATTHCAVTCRWSVPTAFMPAPFWFEGERSPWTCLREAPPRILDTSDICVCCSDWEPPTARDGGRDRPVTGAGPTAADWFAAFPMPHEVLNATPWVDES